MIYFGEPMVPLPRIKNFEIDKNSIKFYLIILMSISLSELASAGIVIESCDGIYEKKIHTSGTMLVEHGAQKLKFSGIDREISSGVFSLENSLLVIYGLPPLRSGMNIHRRADVGVGDANVAAITTPVNGGSAGLSERQEFFRYVYFILGDGLNMPTGIVRQLDN